MFHFEILKQTQRIKTVQYFPRTSVQHADVFVFPTWAAQSRGVTAGSEGCVAGWGDTFEEGKGRLKTKRLIS